MPPDLVARAEAGGADAQAQLGTLYADQCATLEPFDGDEPAAVDRYCGLAIEWLAKAATHGDAQPALRLALFYAVGAGAESDARALEWFRKAADAGSMRAQFEAARLVDVGRGAPRDRREALRRYTAVADVDAGMAPLAQYRVGFAHEHGLGTARDRGKALAWYRRAAALGNRRAQLAYEALLAERPRAEVPASPDGWREVATAWIVLDVPAGAADPGALDAWELAGTGFVASVQRGPAMPLAAFESAARRGDGESVERADAGDGSVGTLVVSWPDVDDLDVDVELRVAYTTDAGAAAARAIAASARLLDDVAHLVLVDATPDGNAVLRNVHGEGRSVAVDDRVGRDHGIVRAVAGDRIEILELHGHAGGWSEKLVELPRAAVVARGRD